MKSILRLLLILLLVGFVAGIVLIPFWYPVDQADQPQQLARPSGELFLYYPRQQDYKLVRQTVTPDTPAKTIEEIPKTVIRNLKRDPKPPDLISVVPEDVGLRSSFFHDSWVVLDFDEGLIGAANGTTGEYVLLYSIVNSILANLDKSYKMVFFMVEGELRNTIGEYGEDSGHIAIDVPLGPRWDERPSS